MKELLVEALRGAMSTLKRHLKLVGGNNVDEGTFRSFLLAEIMRLDPKAKGQIEWHRFDLFLQCEKENALIEIKFYLPDRTMGLDGTPGNWKGRASLQNEREFRECVSKLRKTQDNIHHKFLILIYETKSERKGKHSFAKSYDDLAKFGLSDVQTVDHTFADSAACKLIRIS